jgi:cation diffusion facilitator CzcD-associated flavoprotein CzcO
MSFSDVPFAYGPFVPHYIPRQYIESYISTHEIDNLFSFNTTVEDVSKLPDSKIGYEKWKLTLRRHDDVLDVDEWWEEEFDAVILANGHYAVPFVSLFLFPLLLPKIHFPNSRI